MLQPATTRSEEDGGRDPTVKLANDSAIATAMSQLDALDIKIWLAEEDIRIRTQQLSELKQQRNARVPVARLPPELLSDIFLRLRDSHTRTHDREVSSFTNSWLAISHVAHAWRETALATPQLWTCADLRANGTAQESMRRARGLPLRLFMPSSQNAAPPSEYAVEAALTHPGGISSLSLQSLTTKLTIHLIPLARCSAACLRVLELGYATDKHRGYFELPGDILDLHFPHLDTLTLMRCLLDNNCAVFPGHAVSLRRLTLVRCPSSFEIVVFTEQRRNLIGTIFKTLQSLQHLEALTFVFCFTGAFDYRWPDIVPELHLPSLRSLYVQDSFSPCAALSRCIRIPETCRTVTNATGVEDLTDLLRTDLFALVSSQPPRTLLITLATTGLSIRSASNKSPFDRTFTLSDTHWSAELDVLAEIGTQLSARAVTICLRVDIPVERAERGALCMLCGGAQAVATLFRLEGTPAALALVAECMVDRAQFLPRLEEVLFRRFDMGAAGSTDIEKWAQALIERKKAGAELSVDFKGCRGVSEQLRNRLEEELDWVS